MHITVEPRDQYSILHLRGEFDTFYCPHLQREIDALIAAGVVKVVLDLRLVKFINSTALGAIIKASKMLAAKGGRLVIARPSTFCRGIIEKVGIDRMVPLFASEEEAGAALLATKGKASGAESSGAFEPEDDASVLFTPIDGSRLEMFLPEEARKSRINIVHHEKTASGWTWHGIGRMSSLDSKGMRFTWNGGSTGLTPFEMSQFLAIGTDLRTRFRLPLLKRGFSEAAVTITALEERPDGIKLSVSFSEIDEETRKAVKQYAEDLAFLKKELKQATDR